MFDSEQAECSKFYFCISSSKLYWALEFHSRHVDVSVIWQGLRDHVGISGRSLTMVEEVTPE